MTAIKQEIQKYRKGNKLSKSTYKCCMTWSKVNGKRYYSK